MIGQNVGKYRVLDCVGRGGMGTVYRAIDETLHREVAIKALNADVGDPSLAKRFRAEAITVARLNHPGIATVFELLQHDGQWLMVMEFLRGETLESLIRRDGAVPVPRAVDLMVQTLDALGHAHTMGVVHRDLKPANLMLTASGAVKVMDFGIARVAGGEQLTRAGFMMGTPAYMAPEQVMGGDIDARTDLYSVGVVLYHLTTGRLPFKGETPMEMAHSRVAGEPTPVRMVREDLPAWLGEVLQIALAKAPEKRFQSAASFRENLQRGLAGVPFELGSALPPELVATAAPSSMPVVQEATPPRSTRPPAEVIPTIAGAIPAPPARPQVSKGRSGTMYGAAAGLVVAALAGGWLLTRSGSEAPTPSETSAPAASADAQVAPSGAAPLLSADMTMPAADVPVASADAVPATEPGPIASADASASSPAMETATAPPPGSAPTGARGAGASAPSTSPAPARRGGGATTPAVAFAGVRALVITGKKAAEVPATLRFADTSVSLMSDTGAVLGTLPYSEVTYASYAHARIPEWSVVLASPPPDVDLPGGLFRSARHWLTLQSRSGYLIVRLNDQDWRSVTDAVTSRIPSRLTISR